MSSIYEPRSRPSTPPAGGSAFGLDWRALGGSFGGGVFERTVERSTVPVCDFTGLDEVSCAHCAGHITVQHYVAPDGEYGGFFVLDDVPEPSWEKADYVETLVDQERQVYPNPDQFSDAVDMFEIYGQHEAVRLSARRIA